MSLQLKLDHTFDSEKMRHYMNGQVAVLHCHHYASLYTQLAIDAKETALLFSVSEDVFGDMLKKYFADNQVSSLSDRIDLACQHYAAMGLGKMSINYFGTDSGEVVLENSHVDQGWVKKWGRYDAPVNYITAGYIAGMFSAVNDAASQSFSVCETESIVKGASQSTFKVFKK